MKYFYSIVVDGYSHAEVTTHRYKNLIDFMYIQMPYVFEHILESKYDDFWDYLDSVGYYPDSDFVALDENNIKVPDIESNQFTFNKIKNKLLEEQKQSTDIDSVCETIYNDCKKILKDEFKDKFNTPLLRKIVISKCEYYLEELKDENKIYNYTVICDETNNNSSVINGNNLVVDLVIKFSDEDTKNIKIYYA